MPGIMDCVTCILVGMCMMCGPGIGRFESPGARDPGRPMTEAEVDQALSGLLRHFRPTTRPSVTYNRRQSFIPDYRFSDIGIGKRQNDETETALQKPASTLSSGSKSDSGPDADRERHLAELLFWPGLRKKYLNFINQISLKDSGSVDSIPSYDENTKHDFRLKLLKSFPSGLEGSNLPSVEEVMKKLKRVNVEEQLLKKIAQGNRASLKLGQLNKE